MRELAKHSFVFEIHVCKYFIRKNYILQSDNIGWVYKVCFLMLSLLRKIIAVKTNSWRKSILFLYFSSKTAWNNFHNSEVSAKQNSRQMKRFCANSRFSSGNPWRVLSPVRSPRTTRPSRWFPTGRRCEPDQRLTCAGNVDGEPLSNHADSYRKQGRSSSKKNIRNASFLFVFYHISTLFGLLKRYCTSY